MTCLTHTYEHSNTFTHTHSLSHTQTESCSLTDRQATDAEAGRTRGDAYVMPASGCYTTSMFTRTSCPERTHKDLQRHRRTHRISDPTNTVTFPEHGDF